MRISPDGEKYYSDFVWPTISLFGAMQFSVERENEVISLLERTSSSRGGGKNARFHPR